MQESTHIGLDVHKETIAVAVLRPGESECEERVIANTPEALRRLLARFPDRAALRTCYEAGPTGYDTWRLLAALGVPCEVIAPSLIPRRYGARVKTDRTDARNLARLHRAGELTAVRVPTPAEEALRDLVRTREDLKSDRRIARQRLKSFLLRYGRRYPVPRGRWGVRYELWLQTQSFEEPAAQAAFDHLMGAASVRAAQLAAIEREIEAAALTGPLAEGVARLRAFGGISDASRRRAATPERSSSALCAAVKHARA
jgi:transposase